MIFLNPLNFIALLCLIGPIILHLHLRYYRREIEYPAMIFFRDEKIPQSKIYRLKNIFLLILRLLIVMLIVFIFSKPQFKIKLPFSKNFSQSGIIVDLSPSMNLSKQPEIIDSVESIIALSGKSIVPSIKYPHYAASTPSNAIPPLDSLKLNQHINLPLAIFAARSQQISPLIIFSDHQKISWGNHVENYSEVYALKGDIATKNFTIHQIQYPPWWITGDSAIFLVTANQPCSVEVATILDTAIFWVEEFAFLPVQLPISDSYTEVSFNSPQDSLTLSLTSLGQIKIYTNEKRFEDILSNLMPDSIGLYENILSNADYAIIDEQSFLPEIENLSAIKNIVIFLSNGQKLKPWIELNYPLNIQGQCNDVQSIYFGNSLLSGVRVSNHVVVSLGEEIEMETQMFFENGNPAVITFENLILFTFNPENSNILWNPGVFIFIFTHWFDYLPPPKTIPSIETYERSNIYQEDLNDRNIPWITFQEAKKLLYQHLYYDNTVFLIILLASLLFMEGYYSHKINY